ncbi:hypothetical protein ACMD2_04745 [Ananas comosus]|uniref:Coenzyme Q-binding protein COQ10 START domain-containing protein n=1 Tax=Ananas comosus TaxID=4615 RepID=A0A199UYE2_ANACO|nr:hypothetical protein ACMD2_04745 [Ananas comosus]
MSTSACVLRWSSQAHLRRAEKGGGASSAAAAAAAHRPQKPALFFAGEPQTRRFPKKLLFPRSASRRGGGGGGGGFSRKPKSQPIRPFTTIEVGVPCSVAYQCYSDRETIPQWMPFISSVKILQDKPDLSRWSLKYEVFGRNVEFSWLARNMQPIPNQKIHWRSLEGLPNRGAVRFFPTGPSSCRIQLTVSYEIPEILAPVASALKPFLEGLLTNGLERFATFARDYERKIPQR